LDVSLLSPDAVRDSTVEPQRETVSAPLFAGADAEPSRRYSLPMLFAGVILAIAVSAATFAVRGHMGRLLSSFTLSSLVHAAPAVHMASSPAPTKTTSPAINPHQEVPVPASPAPQQPILAKEAPSIPNSAKTATQPIRAATKTVTQLPAAKYARRQTAEVASAPETLDPERLWEQVRQEKTPAEVSLAKLYLEGNTVPQNCEQAHILLLSASKKGSRDAAHLLSDSYAKYCQ